MIVVDVRGKIGGTLVRLSAEGDGRASGRFLPLDTSFMWLRHTLDFAPPSIWEPEGEPVHSVTNVDPTLLHTSSLFAFIAQWYLPEVAWGMLTDDREPGVHLFAPDGSRASVQSTPTEGGFPVTQAGPSRLWERVEDAQEFWQQAGRPSYDRFGITASATEQCVWYDRPESEHRWPLPAPPQPLG